MDVKIETKEGVNVCSSALFRDSGVLEGDAIRSEDCLCISVDVPACLLCQFYGHVCCVPAVYTAKGRCEYWPIWHTGTVLYT